MKYLIDLSLKDLKSETTYSFVVLNVLSYFEDNLSSVHWIGFGRNIKIREERRVMDPMTIKKYF